MDFLNDKPLLAIAREAHLDFEHHSRLEGEFFDQRGGNQNIVGAGTQVVGGPAEIPGILSALEQSGAGDKASGLERVTGQIEDQMTAGAIRANAKTGLFVETNQLAQGEFLNLLKNERRHLRLGRRGFGGHFRINHGGHQTCR